MNHKWVTVPIYVFAAIYFAAVLFIKPHLGAFYGPRIGSGFSKHSSCETNIEALVIASTAMPFLYEGADFGLVASIKSLQTDGCQGGQVRYFAHDYVTSIQNLGEMMGEGLINSRPPALLYRRTHSRVPKGYFPRWPFGDIWLLIKSYPNLYSGKGIKHYLRCDYSLNLEPYHSFILSDMHLGDIADTTRDRLNECALYDEFTEQIHTRISESLMLSPVFQD